MGHVFGRPEAFRISGGKAGTTAPILATALLCYECRGCTEKYSYDRPRQVVEDFTNDATCKKTNLVPYGAGEPCTFRRQRPNTIRHDARERIYLAGWKTAASKRHKPR